MNYDTFYTSIDKPFFAPEAWVFGLAWGIIYPLIAIAFIYFVYLLYNKKVPRSLLWVFLANILLNVFFTPIQLLLGSLILATVDIVLVLGTLLYFELKIWRYSKTVFALLTPYLLWGIFATVLQISILFLNI